MAEQRILYEVEVKGFDKADANLVKLKKEFDENKKKIDELAKSNKESQKVIADKNKLLEKGIELTEEDTQAIEDSNKTIAENNSKLEELKEKQQDINKQKREAKSITEAYNKVINSEIGSNDQLKARLKILTAEYNSMGAEKRINTEEGKALTASIRTITDTLKANESAVGDNRRNVGNYASALSGLGGPIGNTIKGVQGFNAALSANPALAVVMVIKVLIDIFKENAVIADQLTFAIAGISSGFRFFIDTIVDTVSNLGKLTTALKNPLKFLSDLASGTLEAGKAGTRAAKDLDDYTESLAKNEVAIKLNNQQIKNLEKSLKDKTKSEKERIQIAEDIAALEVQNAKLAQENAEKELAAEKLKLDGKRLSAEEKARLTKLEGAVEEARIEADIALSQKQTRINILLQKEQTASFKAEKKQQGETEEEYQKRIEALRNEFLLSEREKIAKSFEDKLKGLDSTNAKELEIITAIENQKIAKLKEFDDKQKEQIEKFEAEKIEAIIKARQEENKKELVELELALFDQLNALEGNKEAQQKAIDAFNKERSAKQIAFLQNETKIINEELSNILSDEEKTALNARLLEVQQAIKGIKDEIKEEEPTPIISDEAIGKTLNGLQAVQQTINAISTGIQANTQKQINALDQQLQAGKISKEKFESDKIEIERKAAEKQKKIQVGQTIIAGLQAGIQALANTTLPFPISLGALIPVAATTGANIAQIRAQKFNTGGFVSGAGTKTSDSIPAMLSNGEYVQRAAAVDYYGTDFMSAINNLQIPKFSTGGLVTPVSSAGTGSQVAAGVSELAQKVQQQEIRVINVESDFSNIQNRVNNVEQARTF
jgi:DNA repair exonuclease SbcCD ATPase subunit